MESKRLWEYIRRLIPIFIFGVLLSGSVLAFNSPTHRYVTETSLECIFKINETVRCLDDESEKYLKDKNYTVHPGFEDQIIEGNYLRDKGVVKDQNFITGKSMYYAIDLALEVVRFFYGDKHTQILLESLQGEMK